MGLIATTKVVTRAEYYGRRSLLQPGNREWVTSIETVNAMGWALPPCLIFKAKVYQRAWYEDKNLPHDWRIEISQNGWTTDEIGLSWLQNHFIPITTSRTKGKYRLLILDGHSSHLTPQFDRICSENDISAFIASLTASRYRPFFYFKTLVRPARLWNTLSRPITQRRGE
ncbi:Pogo transposable element [Aspergillus sclerotialis]|uniref:Pogo transposable element n=1 Tax=Aspergillus sclerotialis TaxID=2070753 RepID=A0A3A2ZA73_9EURO|nr:Pogo transposable element [Aspergillus sclerotialis]